MPRPPITPVAAVILAAGESSRMGQCKALIAWSGSTLIQHIIECHQAAGCSPVLVVVGGSHEDEIRKHVASMDDVLVVQNPNPSLGMLSSIQRGLEAAVHAGAKVMTFCPVDVPLQGALTVKATLTDLFGHQAECAVASFEGRRGHPVAISRRVAQALLALDSNSNTREALAEFSPVFVPTTDPAVCENLNSPNDVRRWNKRVEPD